MDKNGNVFSKKIDNNFENIPDDIYLSKKTVFREMHRMLVMFVITIPINQYVKLSKLKSQKISKTYKK